MNNYLILSDEILLVSDELIREGDTIISQYDNNGDYCIQVMKYTGSTYCKEPMKLLGGTPSLPKITFSEEAYKEMKERFGWVDIEREANNFAKEMFIPKNSLLYDAFKAAFKLCQSLNKNRFIEEDMVEFAGFLLHNFIGNYEGVYQSRKNLKNERIYTSQELLQLWQEQRQPKRVKVEVEMGGIVCQANAKGYECISNCECEAQPKISNNTIKITKLC